MFKKLSVYLQYFLPQHYLTKFVGYLANSHQPFIKNFLIKKWFLRFYRVNLSEAVEENPHNYASFNDFFIRRLKPECRPIAFGPKNIISPADGCIAACGSIKKESLLQAKNFYFDLAALLANDQALLQLFDHGDFLTLYLAPHNYHRVHMPFTGSLERCLYVPGKLFSVNRLSTQIIPDIYSRNERYIAVFKTAFGYAAIILVGALICGSIHTAWQPNGVRSKNLREENYSGMVLEQGQELGYFRLGSTVILLFQPHPIDWRIAAEQEVKFGQLIANLL